MRFGRKGGQTGAVSYHATMEVTLSIPDELADVLHDLDQRDDRALVVEAVCGLYSRRRLSAGKAARLLNMDRLQFQQELGKREIPINYSLEDLKHDIAFARGQ